MAIYFNLNEPFAAAEMQMFHNTFFRGRSHLELMQVTHFNIFRTNQRFGRFAVPRTCKAFNLRSVLNQRRFADKCCHERCFRFLVNIPRGTLLFQASLINDHNFIRHFNRFILVMGYENRGDTYTLNQFTQPSAQLLADLRINSGKRFI
ncbi:hypothetical protein D3C75_444760 [compost metagenome]